MRLKVGGLGWTRVPIFLSRSMRGGIGLWVCSSLNLSKALQFGSALAPPRLPHFKHCLRHDKK